MTDKELLELSAKACGKQLEYRRSSDAYYYDDEETGREEWYPLENKAQCLQMEIDLKMSISWDLENKHWRVTIPGRETTIAAIAYHQDRQRASVMAAAVIGKEMAEKQENIDWGKLRLVHEKARQANVSYSLHYCEPDNSWFFAVSSAAPSEEWVGKNHSFDIAVVCVLEWLDRVINGLTP